MKKKNFIRVILIVLIIFMFFILLKNKMLKIFYPKPYSDIVSIVSERENVDGNLIFAVIKAESDFNPDVVSNKGALGLMQVMEETAKDVVEKYELQIELDSDKVNIKDEILSVQNNIMIGTKYLSVLLDKYQNKEVAVAAYNAGIGTVDDWIENGVIKADGTDIENIPYKETNNYVRKILKNYEVYEKLY